MLRVDIFNGYVLKDICMQYTEVQFTRMFRGAGTFSITLNSLEEARKFSIGNYVLLNSDWYIVENIHKYKNADRSVKVEVTGEHINSLLKKRVFYSHVFRLTNSNVGTYEENIENIIKCNFIDPYDNSNAVLPYIKNSKRIIPDMVIDSVVSEQGTGCDYTAKCITVYEALNVYCGYAMLGYRLDIDTANKKIRFKVLEPVNKSKEVIFSEEYGNVSASDYYKQIESITNSALRYIEETKEEVTTYTSSWEYDNTHYGNEPTGIERNETLISGTDTTAVYDTEICSANTEIIDGVMYKYRQDYDIGTLVTYFDNDLGISTVQQIKDIKETHNETDTVDITIGDYVPTIFDKLKKGSK